MWMVIVGSPSKYPHNNDKTIETRMNLVNIGNAQILTIPGEALPNIGYYIKRHMKGQHHLLFGLTNDAFGYILTKVDFNSFKRYEYVSQTSLGEMTGEILIENALKLVEESPAPARRSSRKEIGAALGLASAKSLLPQRGTCRSTRGAAILHEPSIGLVHRVGRGAVGTPKLAFQFGEERTRIVAHDLPTDKRGMHFVQLAALDFLGQPRPGIVA